jgi:hypothetical protein
MSVVISMALEGEVNFDFQVRLIDDLFKGAPAFCMAYSEPLGIRTA